MTQEDPLGRWPMVRQRHRAPIVCRGEHLLSALGYCGHPKSMVCSLVVPDEKVSDPTTDKQTMQKTVNHVYLFWSCDSYLGTNLRWLVRRTVHRLQEDNTHWFYRSRVCCLLMVDNRSRSR